MSGGGGGIHPGGGFSGGPASFGGMRSGPGLSGASHSFAGPATGNFAHSGNANFAHSGNANVVHSGNANFALTGNANVVHSGNPNFAHSGNANVAHSGNANVAHSGNADLTHAGNQNWSHNGSGQGPGQHNWSGQNANSWHHNNNWNNNWNQGHHDWDHHFYAGYGRSWYGGWGWGWGYPFGVSLWWGYPYWGGYWGDYLCPYGAYYPTYYPAYGTAYLASDYGYNYGDTGVYAADPNGPYTVASPPDATAQEETPADVQQADNEALQYYNEARAAFEQGNYREALRLAGHSGVEAPQNPKVHELTALALFASGDYKGAATEAHAALAFGSPSSWAELYGYYNDNDRYTEQLRKLEKTVATVPNSAPAHFLLGYQYLMTGAKAEAKEHFATAAKLTPNDKLAQHIVKQLDAGGTVTPPELPKPPSQGTENPPQLPAAPTQGQSL